MINFSGVWINHKQYFTGTVCWHDEKSIQVRFVDHGIQNFDYASAFKDGTIWVSDYNTQQAILKDIEISEKLEKLEYYKEKATILNDEEELIKVLQREVELKRELLQNLENVKLAKLKDELINAKYYISRDEPECKRLEASLESMRSEKRELEELLSGPGLHVGKKYREANKRLGVLTRSMEASEFHLNRCMETLQSSYDVIKKCEEAGITDDKLDEEIPPDLTFPKVKLQNCDINENSALDETEGFKLGGYVFHERFGKGQIIDIPGAKTISVFFPEEGDIKRLAVEFAPITVVEE